jgi:hypothetical protein
VKPDDVNNGNPWSQILKQHGPTALIAVYLVYFLAGRVSPVLDKMATFMETHVVQMQTLADDQKKQDDAIARQWIELRQDREIDRNIAQQTCINTAKNAYQQQRCLDFRDQKEAFDAK